MRLTAWTLAMPRLSMNELTTFRWSFDEDLLHYQRAGYDAIGVWRRKLTDFGEERAVELLTESGLAVSNLLWAGGFTGNDGRTQAESLADARAAIRTAAVIDAGCLVLYTGGRNNHTQRHADRLVRHALDTLLAEADAAGVTLAIEPMHAACGGEWSVLSSLEETCTLLADYAHPRLKMVYDTYHFPACDGVAAMLGELAPLIAVVHLGDTATPHSIDQERCPLGEGGTPVREAIAGLIAAGYEGDFDVELMGSATEGVAYPELLSRSRCLFREALSAAGAVPR